MDKFDLQMFAEDGVESQGEPATPETEAGGSQEEKKYTDKDLDRIIEKKFAKWQKQQDAKVTEAEKLASRNASKQSEDRIKDLEDKLGKYEKERTHNQMMAQARAMLQEDRVNISDKLLENLVTDEADTTEESVKEFVKLFREEVSKAVKEELKGGTPKKGSASKLTKEQIMKVQNPIERQKLIRDNIDLFK